MHPKSSSSPAKPAIDRAFYEHLNTLKQRRSPLNQPGQLPDAPAPTLVPGFFEKSPLPCLKDTAAVLASSEPKLVLIPKSDKHSIGNVIVEQDASPCHQNTGPASRAQVTPLALSGSGRSGKSARTDQTRGLSPSQSPSPRAGNKKADNSSRRSSPRVSPAPSPAPSPRGLPDEKSSGISVSSASTSDTSSAESSPATTPRGRTTPTEKMSKVRKLARKATGGLGDIAEALRNQLTKSSKTTIAGKKLSRPSSGGNSPRVRFLAANDIDQQVDLADPACKRFIRDVAQDFFMKTWEKEAVGTNMSVSDREKYEIFLKSTFMRDFGSSTYRFRNERGDLEDLNTIDEFIKCLGGDSQPHLVKAVSHIVTQNLTLFLKHVLFERRDEYGAVQSELRLSDGTPLVPVARFRTTYDLSSDVYGNIIIDYQSNISSHSNNAISVRVAGIREHKTFLVSDDAKLQISTRITVEPDGEWHIANPRVRASGWSIAEPT